MPSHLFWLLSLPGSYPRSTLVTCLRALATLRWAPAPDWAAEWLSSAFHFLVPYEAGGFAPNQRAQVRLRVDPGMSP